MAAVAGRRQIPGISVGPGMAPRCRTGQSGMRPGQRECRGVVIESGRGPVRCRMADRAVLRECRRNVVRNIGPVCARGSFCPYIYVAVVASGGTQGVRGGPIMAGSAGRRRWRHVHSRQSETGGAVVKGRGPT